MSAVQIKPIQWFIYTKKQWPVKRVPMGVQTCIVNQLCVCGMLVANPKQDTLKSLYSLGQNNYQMLSLAQPSYFSSMTELSLQTEYYM